MDPEFMENHLNNAWEMMVNNAYTKLRRKGASDAFNAQLRKLLRLLRSSRVSQTHAPFVPPDQGYKAPEPKYGPWLRSVCSALRASKERVMSSPVMYSVTLGD
ncbi:hypothetical protein N0V85_005559 [Neurospora sp. IMI 360204]|nr:hypothetical protein N0V85_005559 [Neurospora sp. IMI 360204]